MKCCADKIVLNEILEHVWIALYIPYDLSAGRPKLPKSSRSKRCRWNLPDFVARRFSGGLYKDPHTREILSGPRILHCRLSGLDTATASYVLD